MNNTYQERPVGELVAEDYRKAGILRNYGIDFCCGGKRTLSDACSRKGLNPAKISEELVALDLENGAPDNRYSEWEPDFLISYIEENHHRYVRTKVPEISAYARKAAKVHGGHHPELVEIAQIFLQLAEELLDHLEKEEQVLFPYIRMMTEAQQKGEQPARPAFGTVENPVNMMQHEHDDAGEAMTRIRRLSSDFTPPEDACMTYRVLFQNLAAFEEDLHKHVHLENNVLFPRALKIERSFTADA